MKREKKPKNATIRCILSTSVSTCFGHHYAHLQEIKDRVLLHTVYSAGSAGCGWYGCGALRCRMRAPNAETHGLCSPEDGHNVARNMLRQKLIINI